jgi:hypothetical protein
VFLRLLNCLYILSRPCTSRIFGVPLVVRVQQFENTLFSQYIPTFPTNLWLHQHKSMVFFAVRPGSFETSATYSETPFTCLSLQYVLKFYVNFLRLLQIRRGVPASTPNTSAFYLSARLKNTRVLKRV